MSINYFRWIAVVLLYKRCIKRNTIYLVEGRGGQVGRIDHTAEGELKYKNVQGPMLPSGTCPGEWRKNELKNDTDDTVLPRMKYLHITVVRITCTAKYPFRTARAFLGTKHTWK